VITSLQIENFKCFKKQTLDFGKLTVLSGANGVGKSTAIQALLLLRETWMRVLATGEEGRNRPLILPVSLNGPLNLSLGNSQSITNAELESDLVRLGVTSLDGSQGEFVFNVDIESPRTTIEFASDPGSSFWNTLTANLTMEEFYYVVAERVGPRDLYGMVDQPFNSTGYAGEYTAQAISKAENTHVASELCVADGTTLFKVQLEAWLEKITPGIQIMTSKYTEVNRVRVGIQRRSAGTGWLSPLNIGFGISYVLPVVVNGLLAPRGSMMIVENPEAHLHPAAQSAIGRFLARVALSGVQVIVETHSEHVVNGARLEALDLGAIEHEIRFLFFSMSDHLAVPDVTSISMDEHGDLSAWPIGFFDQQTKDLSDIFRARRASRKS